MPLGDDAKARSSIVPIRSSACSSHNTLVWIRCFCRAVKVVISTRLSRPKTVLFRNISAPGRIYGSMKTMEAAAPPAAQFGPIESLRLHWPEYLMEAAALGTFMISACIFGVLLEHPMSPANQAIGDPVVRR